MNVPFDFFYQYMNRAFFESINANIFIQQLDQSAPQKFYRITSLDRSKPFVLFNDQEPIDSANVLEKFSPEQLINNYSGKLLINSEKSLDKDYILNRLGLQDVHYFYHALLCHEWYRSYWYHHIDVNFDFSHVFISFNHLNLDKRLYRANLIVELANRNLLNQGLVSFRAADPREVTDSASKYLLLPSAHRQNIQANLDLLSVPRYIDTNRIQGSLSAEINIPQMQRAFVNLVTETVFYENKVHLTEKIFKPIVAKMPFLLLAGAGNLAYLKSYGFKTFGDYWDESYDSITDNTERFSAVLSVLERLCSLPYSELVSMRKDMQGILEYNYLHFYKDMRSIVAKEFADNLTCALNHEGIAFDIARLRNLERVLAH